MGDLALYCATHLTSILLLTFCFLLAKEALCHFSEEFLGRAGGVELWHHYTAAGGKLIRGETLEEEEADTKGEEDASGKFSVRKNNPHKK